MIRPLVGQLGGQTGLTISIPARHSKCNTAQLANFMFSPVCALVIIVWSCTSSVQCTMGKCISGGRPTNCTNWQLKSVKLIMFIWMLTLAIFRVTKTYRLASR